MKNMIMTCHWFI